MCQNNNNSLLIFSITNRVIFCSLHQPSPLLLIWLEQDTKNSTEPGQIEAYVIYPQNNYLPSNRYIKEPNSSNGHRSKSSILDLLLTEG